MILSAVQGRKETERDGKQMSGESQLQFIQSIGLANWNDLRIPAYIFRISQRLVVHDC